MYVIIKLGLFKNAQLNSPDLVRRSNNARINKSADVPPSKIVFESWSSLCLFWFDVFVRLCGGVYRRTLTSMVPTADVSKSSNSRAGERLTIGDPLILEEPMQFLLH
jgi:hypothetical protein